MMLSFSVKNMGPFKDKVTLSLEATTDKSMPDNVLDDPALGYGILSTAGIFGPNSSGKTFLIRSIRALQDLVCRSHTGEPGYGCYTPFRFSRDSLSSPTELAIRFLDGGRILEYGIEFVRERILDEYVTVTEGNRERTVFHVSEGIFDDTVIAESYGRKEAMDSLLFSASSEGSEICSRVRFLIGDIITVTGDESMLSSTLSMIGDSEEARDMVLKALDMSDFDITDIRSDTDRPGFDGSFSPGGDAGLSLLYSRVDEEFGPVPGDLESSGTLQYISNVGMIVSALLGGRTLFIDEFGSKVHPAANHWLLGLFDAPYNPNRAQLVVITHDLSLMDIRCVFRRDQIYFVNRMTRRFGSELYSLSDFKGVRKDSDILKAYMSGRFDAVPNSVPRSIMP